jgi:hypothetical protein
MKYSLKPFVRFFCCLAPAFAVLLAACSSKKYYGDSTGTRGQALTCNPADSDWCCVSTRDKCDEAEEKSVYYGDRINNYLGFEAKSNGACTESISGAYQCAAFAKNFYVNKLKHVFSHQWTPLRGKKYVNEALDVEATYPNPADPLFVFQTENSGWNSTAELPRETDILVFENGGAGHFVVAKPSKRISDNEFHIRIIEQNIAALLDYGPGGSCHNRVLVATKQGNGKWSIPSGIGASYVYAGFIRHNLAGIYGDNGWHDDDTSRAFRNAYLRYFYAFVDNPTS